MTASDMPIRGRPDLTAHQLGDLTRMLREHRQARADQLTALELHADAGAALDAESRARAETVARAVLELVDGALQRLDDGSYGWCLRCVEPIAAERLMVMPYVAYCVPCQVST